jgi:flagellar hook assembly protein FlgD
MPHPGRVRLTIVDVTGRLVRTVTEETRGAGDHQDRWDGRDERGREVPSGVYFSVLETGGESYRRRLVLVR